MTLVEIKKSINDLAVSELKIKNFCLYGENYKSIDILRNALICYNAIGHLTEISNEEKVKLYRELDGVMKNRIKELNPNFSDQTLEEMISGYKRGHIIYPMDILVLDDAVFHREGIYDDFGSIYTLRTIMLEGRNSYYNAASDSFNYTHYDISVLQKIECFTREDDMFTSKFISDSINSIYKTNATKPKCELNTGGLFYGYRGISFEGMNIYINMTLDDIERNIKHKKECDIKICIQDGEDIILYYVHQSFNNDNPVWNVVRTSNVVWSLTEEALKLSSPYKRVKKEDK